MQIINLNDKFSQFNDFWSPKIIGDLGAYQVKVAKFHDQFVWHHHVHEDEFFLVITGTVTMHIKAPDEETYVLHEGEGIVVPHGTEHMPVASGTADVLLLEPATTLNTGNVTNEKTVKRLKRL